MQLRRYTIAILCFAITSVGFTQSSFQLFFEKAYLHTDRNYYAAGEDVWFQAYLVNAQTGIRINTSANLYVELISPESKVVDQEMLHLVNGLAAGDFKLPDNAAAGKYRIRAYTNWMKNFGDMFFFEREFEIAADEAIKTKTSRYLPVIASAITSTATVGSNHIIFFPEGGTMVAGLPTRMSFKATDAIGKSIPVKGKIITAAGDSVAAFESTHAGMGSFVFTPVAGIVYTANGKYDRKEIFNDTLPKASSGGYVLSIKDDGLVYTLMVYADDATRAALGNQSVTIVSRHAGKICYSDSLVFKGRQAQLLIPKDSLKAGLNAITLYDEALIPHAERLVFVSPRKPLHISLTTDQPAYSTRQQTTVNITVTDADNRPVGARFSLAATDAGLIQAASSNIVSYLQLESEIRGEIENPMHYFNITNTKREEQLDLLLQTQGWREFLWRRVRDASVVVKYMPEPGVTLSGRVRRALTNTGIGDLNITLYAEKSSGNKMFSTKTDYKGRYFLDSLPLVGWQTVKLTARNKKGNKEGMILLDSVLAKSWPVRMRANLIYDTSDVVSNFRKNAVQRKNIMQQQEKFDNGELGNVTVKGVQKPTEQLQERGMRFGNDDSLFIITGADKKFKTLAQFIVQHYPGAYTDANSDGFFFYGDRGRKILPRWIVDKQEERFSVGSPLSFDAETGANEGSFERVDYYSIPIEKVKKVYIEPIITSTGSRRYVIHLSLWPGAFDTDDLSQVITQVNGYYEARRYYVPDFATANTTTKSDLRSTIFWSPNNRTDAAGKAIVTFKNGDTKTNILVDIEGVTDQGVPIAATVKYLVR